MKRKLTALLIILCMVLTLLCGCAPEAPDGSGETVSITDCAGRTVEVPKDPRSICCICPFSGAMIVMFGFGDRLTTSCNNMVRSRLLTNICPAIADTVVVKNSGSVNAETVLEKKTDLIFVNDGTYETDDERAKLDALGIPYVVVGFTDLAGQMEAMMVIGRALGAEDKAQSYVDWCRGVYADVQEKLEGADTASVRLYHAVNEATRTDYRGSICAEWIAMTGVTNVSLDGELSMENDKAYVSLEQVYSWAPQMMICNEPGVDEYIMSDGKGAGLECVLSGRVYQMPVGISRMGHPTSTETPLALIWLANLLCPELYPVDYPQVLKDYYRDFYGYELDDETVQAIISAEDMRAEKTNSSVE